MLKIKNVSALIDTTEVLKNINLEFKPNEVHAILGPKGSGKSALAHLIQGNHLIVQTEGTISFNNKNINKLPAHKRSKLGIFTSFQYPVEIEGLTNLEMIRATFETKTGGKFTAALEESYRRLVAVLGLSPHFPDDMVNNIDSSPDECKKNEIIQMALLQPDLIVLDEIDVDLNKTSLEAIILILKEYITNNNKSLVIITQNTDLLDQIPPDRIHVLVNGEIREQGGTELYKRIIEDGDKQFS
jgi:Fe-S cluster assembly ATP-binding protein